MAKQGENIYLRSDGRWEGKYIRSRFEGKIQYGYLTGKSYEEVLCRKREKQRELKKRGVIAPSNPLLFSTISDRWLESRRGILKETTIVKYEGILKKYIIPQYGGRRVDDLTDDEIVLWLQGLLLQELPDAVTLSAKSLNSITSVMRLVLTYAWTFLGIPVPMLKDVYFKQCKNPIEVLSHRDCSQLEEYLLENMDYTNLGIMCSLYTGIRLGEVCALHWGDVLIEDALIDVHATMSRVRSNESGRKTKIIITPPKSECSIRRIPIPADLIGLMREMKRSDKSFFLTGRPEKYLDPRTLQKRFKAALEKCGIEPVKYHDLRHTFATRCIELGFDVKALSEILGHADVTITMNRYVHPTILMKKDYMNRLSLTYGENTTS